jgi:hypothetical protein
MSTKKKAIMTYVPLLLIFIMFVALMLIILKRRNEEFFSTQSTYKLSNSQLEIEIKKFSSGDCLAATRIGDHYFMGLKDNEREAIDWYRKGVECGNLSGIENFAVTLMVTGMGDLYELNHLRNQLSKFDTVASDRIKKMIDEYYLKK